MTERVRSLIELATRATTPIEEARSAALEACRAIAKHGLRVVDRVADEVGREVKRETERGASPDEDVLRRAVAKGTGKAAEKLAEEGIAWLFRKGRR